MFTLRRDRRPRRRTGGQGPRRARSAGAQSRVSGLPEFFGELPVVVLAEEIETPGEGQIRALITIAGNPASSTPDSDRLDRALASLDFMVSVDIYVNETTRHANVILPPEAELARGHYDLALYTLAIRNVANYSPPLVELEPGEVPEWQHDAAARRRARRAGRERRRRRARRLRRHRELVQKAVAQGRLATSKAATPTSS